MASGKEMDEIVKEAVRIYQSGPSRVKWEYYTGVTVSDDQLARLGDQGWQLVAVDMHNRFYFLRPTETPSPEDHMRIWDAVS